MGLVDGATVPKVVPVVRGPAPKVWTAGLGATAPKAGAAIRPGEGVVVTGGNKACVGEGTVVAATMFATACGAGTSSCARLIRGDARPDGVVAGDGTAAVVVWIVRGAGTRPSPVTGLAARVGEIVDPRVGIVGDAGRCANPAGRATLAPARGTACVERGGKGAGWEGTRTCVVRKVVGGGLLGLGGARSSRTFSRHQLPYCCSRPRSLIALLNPSSVLEIMFSSGGPKRVVLPVVGLVVLLKPTPSGERLLTL